MRNNKKIQSGFTLIELMIVVAIIGILAAISLPAYDGYLVKSKYSEIVSATYAIKGAVDVCGQDQGKLDGCSGNSGTIGSSAYGITNILVSENPADNVSTITVVDGVVTAIAIGTAAAPKNGLKGETYILKPVLNASGQVIWTVDPASSCKYTNPPYC